MLAACGNLQAPESRIEVKDVKGICKSKMDEPAIPVGHWQDGVSIQISMEYSNRILIILLLKF